MNKPIYFNRNEFIWGLIFEKKKQNIQDGISIIIIDSLKKLKEYKTSWNTLALQSFQRSPMNSWAWISGYFEKRLCKDEQWCCILAQGKDRQLLGILPIIVTPSNIFDVPYPILRTPGDDHTMAIDMVIRRGYEPQVVNSLIDAVFKKYPSCRYLEFSQIIEQSPTRNWIKVDKRKFFFVEEELGSGAYVKTDRTFETYFSGLNKKFQRNLTRACNKLKNIHESKIEFIEGKREESFQFLRMIDVEDKSWKGKKGTSILKSQSLVEFYSIICNRLADAGWLEWHFFDIAGQSIAANMAINFAGSIILWKIGYDETHRKLSPGNILLEKLIERACKSESINEINFLTNMEWNKNWKVEKRKYYRVKIFSGHPIPLLLNFVPIKIKHLLRRVPIIRKFNSFLNNYRQSR